MTHSPAWWRANASRVRSTARAGDTAANTASESITGTSGTGGRLDGAGRIECALVSASNGNRKPPRPRIELVSSGASPSEAAAIVAALEQFLIDTAPAPEPRPAISAWQRAALEEGIGARQLTGSYVWGHAPEPRR